MESLGEFQRLLATPGLREPRRIVCRTLSTQLADCGERLWAFGLGPVDLRMACSVVIQFGGRLASGAVSLGQQENWYAAAVLVRQLVEVEYLVRQFRQDSNQALRWLTASGEELRASFRPAQMSNRAGGFRHEEYRAHCDFGGHPSPGAHSMLPGGHFPRHLPPFGTSEVF